MNGRSVLLPANFLETGLTEAEAQRQLKLHGLNVLATKKRFYLLREFFISFFSPLTILLFAASGISAVLGDIKDFFLIVTILLVSNTVSFYQHFKAEHEAEKLKKKVQLSTAVIRDGIKKEIPFSHVALGDLLVLGVGDIIPADASLLYYKDLSVDESLLTGEAFPVDKNGKNQNIFMGTHIVTGEAKAVVVAIGKDAKFGHLAKEILTQKPTTAFDSGIKSFSVLIVKSVVLLTILLVAINLLLHHNFLTSFLFALAIAVGLTPELLPVIITITLSKGAMKMEKKDVIVKYLPSIQNLGNMNILCTDKTGTLTESLIILNSFENALEKEDEKALSLAVFTSILQAGFKNPLDKELLTFKDRVNETEYKKIDELPFDFKRKCLSVIVSDHKTGKPHMFTKGAAHAILDKSDAYQIDGKVHLLTVQKRKNLFLRYQQLSEKGYRVIAVAEKNLEKKQTYSLADEKKLCFVGFLTFTDPVKSSVRHTLQKLEQSGISVKILTGDNEYITKTVCAQAGIPVENILLGPSLEKMPDSQLSEAVGKTTIFARLSPEEKERIIVALKRSGNVVGYLGDGINDAPPLKSADVGISVNNGSDIAKDVADIVLMKKSFETLHEGVLEGRKVYGNILKFIMMQISSNFGNMITVAISSVFLPFLPILPAQILLIDFLYDLSQITIPSDNVDSHFISKPKKWDIRVIRAFMLVFGPISSIFDFLTFFMLLVVLRVSVPAFRTGWFIESLVTQTLIIFAIRTAKLPFFKSKPSWFLVGTVVAVLFGGMVFVMSPFGNYFAFTKLPLVFYLFLVLAVIAYFLSVEFGKKIFYTNILAK